MRSLYVIPAMAGTAALATGLLGASAWQAGCAAAAAAAVTHAVRTLTGDAPAALAGAMLAAQLAIVSMIERAGVGLASSWLALAATAWAVAELARAPKSTDTPHREAVALVPAIVATLLAPGCAVLCAIIGVRLLRPPPSNSIPEPISDGTPSKPGSSRPSKASIRRRRPHVKRWVAGVPIAGCVIVLLAIVAGSAGDGALATLAAHWFGAPPQPAAGTASIAALADGVGPLAAVAALAGLALLARMPSLATFAIAACIAGALLVDLRAGAPTPLTFGLASTCAGVAVGRFAGTIRLASGQAIAAATCGLMLLLPPAWAIIG